MKKMLVSAFACVLFLAGCDNASNGSVSDEGNFMVKKETLSLQNEKDIRADLSKVNPIINRSNSKAVELNRELITASKNNDNAKINTIFRENKESLESTNKSLFALTIKSQEVQEVRLGIYQGNMLSIKFYDLFAKENKSDKEKEEVNLMKKQMIALQTSIGGKLNQLNSQYQTQ